MTVSHLLFALVTTAYILVAIRFEEADLMKEHPEYAVYRRQVPMLVPRITRDVSFAPRAHARELEHFLNRYLPAHVGQASAQCHSVLPRSLEGIENSRAG